MTRKYMKLQQPYLRDKLQEANRLRNVNTQMKTVEDIDSLMLDDSWLRVIKRSHDPSIPTDKVMVRFDEKLDPRKQKVIKVTIRIGVDIIDKLGWEFKDRLIVYNHPDNLMAFKLVKTEMAGFTLSKEGGGRSGVVVYTWNHKEFKPPIRSFVEVAHIEYKNTLG